MISPVFAPIPRDGREEAIWKQLKRMPYFPLDGEVGVKDITVPYGWVTRFGAKCDSVTDDATAVQNAVDSASAGDSIFFPATTKVGTTIQVNIANVSFVSTGNQQGATGGMNYTGTGPAIQLDVDDAAGWSAGNYNGRGAGFGLVNFYLKYAGSATTNLLNGLGTYGTGTYGIRDWRGGSIRLVNSRIQGFAYGFWGVQSDINRWDHVLLSANHVGAYFGPRSDQFLANHIWTFHNDIAWQFQGSNGQVVNHWITDTDGSTTTNPCVISSYIGTPADRACKSVVFNDPWLENVTGGTQDVEAFFEVGVADTLQCGTLVVNRPVITTNFYSTGGLPHTFYVVKADNAMAVEIHSPVGAAAQEYQTNIRALFSIVNAGATTTVPFCTFSDVAQPTTQLRLAESTSATTTPMNFGVHSRGQATGPQVLYGLNAVGGTGTFSVAELRLNRRIGHSSAPPFSPDTVQQGDITFNQFTARARPLLWWTISSGPANSRSAPLMLDTPSTNRGDNSVTIAVGQDDTVQLFGTALTANRTVTLSEALNLGPGGVAVGSLIGSRFRIVRQAAATGAFNLIVADATGPTTLYTMTAASQWCEVQHNGTIWVLIGAGTL